MKAEKEMNVEVHYTGKHEDGTVFDSSVTRGETLNVTIGSGEIIPGFDEAIIDMEIGDKKTVTIKPESGYGERIAEAVQEMPVANLPEGISVGDNLQGSGPDGQPIMATIEAIDGDNATVDFNHPLAGKTIIFDIELVKINESVDTPETESETEA